MAYLRLSEARALGRTESARLQKSAATILIEEARAIPAEARFDVFLSHSFRDAQIILALKRLAQSGGLSVYVDWLDDPGLDRDHVTAATAATLQRRMRASSSLVYAHSPNASDSTWMPWELGFFDGLKPGFVWVLPLVDQDDSEFTGQEYLGLYPALENLEDVSSRISLGFTRVTEGNLMRTIPLLEAARGVGLVKTAKGW
jgi:hypothetical protein